MFGTRWHKGVTSSLCGIVLSGLLALGAGCDEAESPAHAMEWDTMLEVSRQKKKPRPPQEDPVPPPEEPAPPPTDPVPPPEEPAPPPTDPVPPPEEPAPPPELETVFAIESPQVCILSTTLAKVIWSTPLRADAQLRWGSSDALESAPVVQPDCALHHCVLLSGLQPGRTYFVQPASTSTTGESAVSSVVSFQMPVLASAIVRQTHPRILFNDEDLPRLRERIAGSHARQWSSLVRTCEGLLGRTANDLATSTNNYEYGRALAFAGLLGGDSRFRAKALDVALECARLALPSASLELRRRVLLVASVYDWIHSYIPDASRSTLRSALGKMCTALEANCTTGEFVWGMTHGHQRPLLLASLATYGESSESASRVERILRDYQEGFLPTWRNYADGGGSLKAWAYTSWTLNMEVEVMAAVKSATGLDWFAEERWFDGMVDWFLMGLRGDGSFCRGGDSRIDGGMTSADWIFALCVVGNYGNPRAKWFANKVTQRIGSWSLLNTYDILWNDPSVVPEEPNGPLSKLFRTPGQVIHRSSWGDDAVIATFRSASDYTLGHTHRDNNSFTLFYKGGLAIDSGIYDEYNGSHHINYYSRTIAHNSMLVYDSSEQFVLYGKTYVNDGGQRWLRGGIDVPFTLPPHVGTVLDADAGYTAGGIEVHEDTQEYTYSLGNAAPSYSSQKLRTFDRHFLWLKGVAGAAHPVVVVFDIVESTSSTFKKTYLLHTQNAPQVSGTLVTATNGGVLHHRTLLPVSPRITVVGGSGKEFWVNGQNYVPSRTPTTYEEGGGYRVEISPSVAARVDEFLHVLHATDVGLGMPAAELVRATGMTGARVGDWTVLFAPGNGGLASTSYSLPASSSRHLLTGMVPGAVYDILVDGVFVATVDASVRGTLRFDSQGAGTVEIRLSAPAVAANP